MAYGADYVLIDSLDLLIEAVRYFMPNAAFNVTTVRTSVTFGF